MVLNTCRFCDHSNPEGAKFCTECGGCLHLLPCPNCGAVTDVTASTCYQCQATLPWHNANAQDNAAPPPEAVKPKGRWRAPVMAGAAMLVTAAMMAGYYHFRQPPPVSAPTAAGGAARVVPPAMETPAVKASTVPVAAPAAAVAPVKSGKGAGDAAALPPVAQKPATGANAAIAEIIPQAASGKGNAATPTRPDGCEDAVAALGLCAVAPVRTPAVTHTQRE